MSLPEQGDSNLYRRTAPYYDLDPRPIVSDDIPFYLQRASHGSGPILELACGTGRVSIPLATAGHTVWGLDLSAEMLQQFADKLQALPTGVRQRIHLTHADMCDFVLPTIFELIIIPFRAFQALTTAEQQNRCLAAVRRHLAPNGRFMINVFRPYHQLDESWVKPEKLDWETIDPRTGLLVRRTTHCRAIDLKNQIIYADAFYHPTRPDGGEDRLMESLALHYYYEEQLRSLLQSSGLQIVEEYGYYDGRPIQEGPELIFGCTSSSQAGTSTVG